MELSALKRQSISIELNGERVASASAAKCVRVKRHRTIRTFGETEPVAWLDLSPSYRLELSQLSGSGQSISRPSPWEVSDFHLATVQDGVCTVYSGCERQELTEQVGAGNGFLVEYAVMTARKGNREEEPIRTKPETLSGVFSLYRRGSRSNESVVCWSGIIGTILTRFRRRS